MKTKPLNKVFSREHELQILSYTALSPRPYALIRYTAAVQITSFKLGKSGLHLHTFAP